MPQALDLLSALSSGPLPAGELVERLGISRPTLSRLIASVGDQVLRYGTARATTYAARRSLAGNSAWPVYRIDEEGRATSIGTLHAVLGGYLTELHEHRRFEFWESLPWWLQDMRPQGFLGRAFAQQRAADLGLPADVLRWTDDHALIALTTSGEDCVGNLLVGETALTHFLNEVDGPVVQYDDRATRFPELAASAMAGETVGSSAGGEQPKFACVLLDDSGLHRSVLVKFSAAQDNPATRRWASLLVAEHLALQALSAAGLPTSHSELFEANGQTFLQVERFDRVPRQGPGRLGRRGVISLLALDGAYVGKADQPWPVITADLSRQGYISAEAHRQAELLHTFGLIIANTDMHAGNLGFLHAGQMPLDIAPAYDMLPMHYAPRTSGVVPDTAPTIRIRIPPSLDAWRAMRPVALAWWEAVRDDIRMDEAMRAGAESAIAALGALEGIA
ncbi:type II toxin-antitoxin system HipA family toxin YjjJ [Uliginosibacterium sp. H3]|uniref:Type II toxin-antitoxin system HipA family toxin YjjJ n=1 Tax=Uliginosibacterium silvisoli TaxID=3114758 RepID=A0ABU6K4H7_9RHOO|nr:type II toxin-antitoxin system HipA family toxin YjjJ [Uliginosibacterium sp. H3]